MENRNQLRKTIYISLFAALMAAGAFISIPIGPVPIVLQNFFVLLAALILGPYDAVLAVILYLFTGLCGLPVFAGGTGGIGKLMGPTGGYLLSYIPAVFITGLISKKLGRKITTDIIAMVIGSAVIYLIGASALKYIANLSFNKTMALGVLPFIPGDIAKITACAFVAKKIRPLIK